MFDPYVYPCREAVAEITKALWAAVRGDQESADQHTAAADAAQRNAVERYNSAGRGDAADEDGPVDEP